MNNPGSKLDSSMAVYAFRYCLGRMTYCVSDCVTWLIANWATLEEQDKTVILKEIRMAIRENKIGMGMDRVEWEKLLDHVTGGH